MGKGLTKFSDAFRLPTNFVSLSPDKQGTQGRGTILSRPPFLFFHSFFSIPCFQEVLKPHNQNAIFIAPWEDTIPHHYDFFKRIPDFQERPLLLPDFFLIIHAVGRLDIHLLISSARNEINLQGTSFRPGSPIACVSINISHIHMPASDTQNVALPYILLLLNFVVFNNF